MALVPLTRHLTGELHHEPVRVVYTTYMHRTHPGEIDNDVLPEPRLEVVVGDEEHSFEGGEITSSDTPIGSLVTVTLSATADDDVIDLSFLDPDVGKGASGEIALATVGLWSKQETPLAPQAVTGQAEEYASFSLRGTRTT